MWIRTCHGELVNLAHTRVIRLGFIDYANNPEGMCVKVIWGIDLSVEQEGNLDYDVLYEGTREECQMVLERICIMVPTIMCLEGDRECGS